MQDYTFFKIKETSQFIKELIYVILNSKKYKEGGSKLLTTIFRILVTLLVVNMTIYIFLVVREKFYLRQNVIMLDYRNIRQEDISEVDINEFIFQGIKARTGDEVRVDTDEKNTKEL